MIANTLIEDMSQEKTQNSMMMFGVTMELRPLLKSWGFDDKMKLARMLYGLHQTHDELWGEVEMSCNEFITAHLM